MSWFQRRCLLDPSTPVTLVCISENLSLWVLVLVLLCADSLDFRVWHTEHLQKLFKIHSMVKVYQVGGD
jgi:hypothetical protein